MPFCLRVGDASAGTAPCRRPSRRRDRPGSGCWRAHRHHSANILPQSWDWEEEQASGWFPSERFLFKKKQKNDCTHARGCLC